MLKDNDLALRLYNGDIDSSFLREPLPPSREGVLPGAVDNQFKILVDKLLVHMAQQREKESC